MAKGQTASATNASNSLITQAGTMTAPIISGLQSQQARDQALADIQGGGATGAYQTMLDTGGYDPTQFNILRGETANIASTGGYDQGMLAGAAYDPSSLALLRGGYGGLATTGGYTDADKAAYMNQATSGLSTTYNQLEEQARLAGTRTGGDSSGAISQMARQLGQQQASATQSAALGLDQQITANKLAGLGGLQTTEAGVAGLGASVAADVAAGKRAGVSTQMGLESGLAGGKQTAASGLSNLYDINTGKITAQGQQVLSALGLNFQTQEQAIAALTQLSKNPGLLQTAIGDVAALGGAAGGAMAGYGLMTNP